jgi:predicted dehydrogenase
VGAGKAVFCEKPVGGTPRQVLRAARAVRRAIVISGVGYNYRWAPLVQYARELIGSGELGRGDRFPHHGAFVPGAGNSIGFENLIVIEDHEFCSAFAEGRTYEPGFEQALAWAAVQDALLRSATSGRWESVVPLLEEARP